MRLVRLALRHWIHGITLFLAVACSSDAESEPKEWQCYLGSRTATSDDYCSCYPETLKPFPGSGPIGTSCTQSTPSDFLCCAKKDSGCTCYYKWTLTDHAYVDEDNCGPQVEKVSSCPPP